MPLGTFNARRRPGHVQLGEVGMGVRKFEGNLAKPRRTGCRYPPSCICGARVTLSWACKLNPLHWL
jgi:hypothetical protein